MTAPTDDQYAQWRAIAEAATVGPWVENVLGSEGYDVRANPDPNGNPIRRIRVAKCGYEKWDTDKANAAHIATFDPETVLALLDALAAEHARADAAEAKVAAVEALIDPEAAMAVLGYGGARLFAESDLRAALATGDDT